MKKGFTLIELLAVIVILAIITLIATPIVLSIIKDSKESASLRSAEMYLKGLETSIATSELNNKNVKDGTYSINNGNICLEYKDNECINELKVEMTGETPLGGKVIVIDGEVKDVVLDYKEKAIVKNKDKLVYSYKEAKNIEVPDLYNGTLTPVIYDGDNWVIVDSKEKWYDYNKQEWANVVILNSDSTKKVGDTLIVDGENPDILGMYVWIPRYEYKIEGTYGKSGTSVDSPGEIEINFININQVESSEGYILHPAFSFGETEISGIWVGKFEIGHATKTSNMNCTDESCEEGNSIRVLPNKIALRSTTVSSFFYGIRSMSKEGNVFGIDSDITDTHMIKNREWGAVAYLTQSKYGKYGNNDYKDRDKEIYINNSSYFVTGRSGGSYGGNTPINGIYLDQTDVTTNYIGQGFYSYDGYLFEYGTNKKTTRDMKKIASTTGNIYGIYDMSGGSWEYVMGVFANSDGVLWTGNSETEYSGFKGKLGEAGIDIDGLPWPDEKYYDVYKASPGITVNRLKACNGGICYGHAISEMSGVYGDYSYFVTSNLPWFTRGGAYYNGSNVGVFNSSNASGQLNTNGSTHIVFSQNS